MATTVRDDEGRLGAVTRVLLVEDDTKIARSIERLLRRSVTSALEVVTVARGEDAALELAHGRFDLVISDYNLAGAARGDDVMAFVRTLANPPAFLFLSSDERCERLGVPYLTKPCPPSEVLAAVLRLLGSHVGASVAAELQAGAL